MKDLESPGVRWAGRYVLAAGPADLYVELGQPSDIPIAARWDSAGSPGDAVSVWRPYPA